MKKSMTAVNCALWTLLGVASFSAVATEIESDSSKELVISEGGEYTLYSGDAELNSIIVETADHVHLRGYAGTTLTLLGEGFGDSYTNGVFKMVKNLANTTIEYLTIDGNGKNFVNAYASGNSEGKNRRANLQLLDGAELINFDNVWNSVQSGGSSMGITGGVIRANTLYVQKSASGHTSGCQINVGEYGEIHLGGNEEDGDTAGALYLEENGTSSSNSKRQGRVVISGEGATLEILGGMKNGEAQQKGVISMGSNPKVSEEPYGSRFLAENGASVTVDGGVYIGKSAYLESNAALSDVFTVNNADFSAVNVYAGYGDGVYNAVFTVTNDDYSCELTSSAFAGYGEGSYNNVFSIFGDNGGNFKSIYSGYGQYSHDNLVEIHNADVKGGTFVGKYDSCSNNTMKLVDVTVSHSYDYFIGGVSNRLEISGEGSMFDWAKDKRGFFSAGAQNSEFVLSEGASMYQCNTSHFFKQGNNNTITIENGGQYIMTEKDSSYKTLHTCNYDTCTTGNVFRIRDNGYLFSGGAFYVRGREQRLEIDNAWIETTSILVGANEAKSNQFYYADNALVVKGKAPRLDITCNLTFTVSEFSTNHVLRFEIPAGGYDYSEVEGSEDRAAPILCAVDSTSSKYKVTMPEGSRLEADVSALGIGDRNRPMTLIVARNAMSIDDSVLAEANVKGAAATYPYEFTISSDKKTLYVTALKPSVIEPKGTKIIIR